jgi:GNAT superfamily N-acetyltransferase
MNVRSATAHDASLLHQLITELARYEESESCVKVTAADLHRQLSSQEPPFHCLIAEVDGSAAGFALYFFAYSTWEGASTIYLEDLYVREEFRGARIGAALMESLASIAEQNGCLRFEWSVLDWNQPAINFYRKIGAQPLAGWTRYRLDGENLSRLQHAI